MSRPDDNTRLRHMLEAAERASELCRRKSKTALERDWVSGLALVHLLEVIGEASRGVSAQFIEAHPEIPWAKMAATRNRLIHGYFDVDMEVVLDTVQEELPPLIIQLRGLVDAHS